MLTPKKAIVLLCEAQVTISLFMVRRESLHKSLAQSKEKPFDGNLEIYKRLRNIEPTQSGTSTAS